MAKEYRIVSRDRLVGRSYRFEREFKIQSRPLTTNWEDE